MSITFHSIFCFQYPMADTLKDFCFHTHELILFLTGQGETCINGINYPYGPGRLCYTQAGDIRSHTCNATTDYICIRFTGTPPVSGLSSGVYTCKNDIIFSLFKDILNEYKDKNINYLELCNIRIDEIFIKLKRTTVSGNYDQTIYSIIKEIDSVLSFQKSVQEMATSISYSYDYFRHKFKDITGKSPTQYIIDKRIENAVILLEKNTYSCTEISQLCGFSSSSQFSHLFKQSLGITPSKYQSLNQLSKPD